MAGDDEESGDLMDIKMGYGLLNAKRAGGEEEVFYRNVRGIVEECCHKPCTMSQMRAYCGGNKRSGPALLLDEAGQ